MMPAPAAKAEAIKRGASTALFQKGRDGTPESMKAVTVWMAMPSATASRMALR